MEIKNLLNPFRRRRIVPVTTRSSGTTMTMKSLSSFTFITIVLLVNFNISLSQVHATTNITEKGGRCPESKMDTRLCGDQLDQCSNSDDCSGDSLCCSTGCNKICILPAYTACEQARNSAERRARSLDADDAKLVTVPECDPVSGKFKQVQCDSKLGCYCVDSQGFELPGTRARSLDAVNCTNPKPCEGPMCRMLCPYGFELDDQGCQICECKNVCKGVKCPMNTECEAEESSCTTEPCPPVPSCKQPRSLDSLCPYGSPLVIPESGNPFLCGNGAGQPTCPDLFQCNVKTGSEYGICCTSSTNFEKPGSCPVVATTKDSEFTDSKTDECTSSCRHDLDCSEFDKCCISQGCGKQCTKPANSTVCLQQKHIAILLSQRELEGKGYIPSCDENGNFLPKQCSRNGKVCWCVSPTDGKNNPQSIGPAESVNCTNSQQRQRAALRSDDSYGCDKVICSNTCEFGYKNDKNGCTTCDCVESPCESFFTCPSDSTCQIVADPSCRKKECPMKPTCLSNSIFVNPCPLGTPLTDMSSAQVVACSSDASTCPSSHICVIVSPNTAGLCCANRPRVEPTKPGMCPFLSPSLCNTNTTLGNSHKKCYSDNDCENSMKCCAAGDCTVCADPLLHEDLSNDNSKQSPTMCQYLRDAGEKVGGIFNKFRLAMSKPQCKEESGEFNEIQCDQTHCMCVDEYGAEIPGTMMDKTNHNLTAAYCIKAKHNPKCLEMNCRLACDYGYETLDGCKICECRNPCMSVGKNGCGEDDELCEMVDIDCWDGHCPPLPFCIPKVVASSGKDLGYTCPKGNAFVTDSNETLTCNPRARMLQCPDDYFCHDVADTNNHDFGLCCPILTEEEANKFLTAEDRKEDSDELDVIDGHFGSSMTTKIGQCPYLIPFSSGLCESECETDYHCPSSKKCCINSCGGSQCTDPLLMTACQHQKIILEHKARENGVPAKRVFIPECDESGEYVRIQSFGKYRWCVDSAGHELQGTRVPISQKPNCKKPAQCPQTKCSLQCEFGLQLDPKGCPVCECKPSPCDDVRCERGEECRMMQLNCISEPCPPVPLCLPRLDNPCAFGAPLSFEETGDRVACGSGFGSCPSSHKCNISPFGEYAVCCPKPKEVCFERRDSGNCKAVITKWFFNSTASECQPFFYSGCGGNSNNQFNSKAECLSVCPTLTHCERMREKNSELVNKYRHLSYIPKCDPRQGEWEPVQCFDEVGMCWCVNKKGEPIKGSMTNGVPNCQARRGRLLGGEAAINPPVCAPGVIVHKCNKTLCENKVCLGHPNAKCMINPCGGCHEKWISEDGEEIDCSSGLGKCHLEMQQVMNSQAWVNQGFSAGSAAFEKDVDVDEYAQVSSASSLGNALSEILLGESQPMENNQNNNNARGADGVITRMSSKVTPIFANFGGHRVMGIMSSSVTIMGGHGGGESEENGQIKRISPVRSIADILADMMTSQSSHLPQRSDYRMDDLIDLMPTSSQIYPRREMLPPSPMVPDFAFTSQSDIPIARVRRGVESAEEIEIPDSISMESSSNEDVISNPEILVSILPRHKLGACPQPSHFALFNLLTGTCQDECHYDSECESHLKCCLSKCGLKCLQPESAQISGMETQEDYLLTAPSGPLTQSYEEYEPPTMIVSLPQCDVDTGNYSPVQTQGDLSWCVTPDGQPMPQTFTRGKVLCSANGTILERFVRSPICSNPDQTPTICREQCMHASCPMHPEAVCVMDVCDNCNPSFYSPSGEKVICEEKCQQPSGEAGFCRASMLRYTYNITSNKCEEFLYGGCHGNDNNFENLQECENECQKTDVDVCGLSVKPGPCRASILRWYFEKSSQSCKQFDYGGCKGNENNFMTKEHCEIRCPDIVVCPNIIDGEMKTCSRTAACKNITCPNHKLEDYICTVDPCTCEAELKDFNGNAVDCEGTQKLELSLQKDNQNIDLDSESDQLGDVITANNHQNRKSSQTHSSVHIPLTFSNSQNQVLQVTIDFSSIKTKCLSMSEGSGGLFSCDEQGHFKNIQCTPETLEISSQCFCVDESGNQIEGSEPMPFTLASKMCQKVPVEKVEVSLNFPVWDDISSVQLGVEFQDLLRSMHATLDEEKVEVEVLPGSTNLRFVLKGENKVDVSFILEHLVKKNAIGVVDQGRFYPADLSTSRFHNVINVISTLTTTETDIEIDDGVGVTLSTSTLEEDNEIPVEEEKRKISEDNYDAVSAESLAVDNDHNTLAVMLTLVAAITAGLVVFGMFLAFQKKKSTGSYPKKPFESLAFSSQVYEIEKKAIPKDFATFKVTPYVYEYKTTDEEKPPHT